MSDILNPTVRADTKTSSHCKLKFGDKIGGYQICDKLGSGRFSTVWSAKKDDDVVAVKVYRAGSSDRHYFDNEVKILNRIAEFSKNACGPNLITYRGAFAHVDVGVDLAPRIHPCVLFNIEGDSVSKLLRYCKRTYNCGLSLVVVKKIMRGTFAGLEYLHNCGIIHTDIKPSNLLMDRKISNAEDDFKISIGDLGSSTYADDIFSDHVGTTQYIAPELILELPYSYPIDIWASFAMCFELLTGDLLFDVYSECGVSYGDDDGEDECCAVSYATTSSDTEDSSGSEDSSEAEQTNYKHLLLIETVIGPAPRLFADYAQLYYNRRGKMKNDPDLQHIGIFGLLMHNYNIDAETCELIEAFLLQGLKYIPAERITATSALEHPFLKEN